jgi:8-oxo-dGTP pyrophosphatase MutT (NUDIX family)
MHRRLLLELLAVHTPYDDDERRALGRIERFVRSHRDCFERSREDGHVTGSAWVTSARGDRVLLVHHAKLDRWLQPGGHADGDGDVARVALREAEEGTGLRSIVLAAPTIYDVDVHAIPERKGEPRHFHYDVRFRFFADPDEAPTASAESHAVRWLTIAELSASAPERSLARMVEKMTSEISIPRSSL